MLKVLYILATALETWLGVWVFSQTFTNRYVMEKKHIVSEIMIYAMLVFGAYSFPVFYYKVDKWRWYLPTLILISLILLIACLLYKAVNKQLGTREVNIISGFLFISMIVWISCQYWSSYQSYSFTLLGNILPGFFLFSFFECTFMQAYLWEFWYCTNLALLKMIYITYIGMFQHQNLRIFFSSSRIHTYNEIIYSVVVCFVLWIFIKHIPTKYILKRILGEKKKRLFATTIVEWFILYRLIISGIREVNKESLTITLILVMGIVIALTWALVNAIGKVIENERVFMEARNKTLNQQYQELNTAYEKYRCLIHDEKNMMLYLRECLDNGDVYSALKFLNSYQNNIVNNCSGFHTGISVLDFILNIKKRKMDELDAKFTFDVDVGKIYMEEADFVAMLGNLLDNAIEAIEKCKLEKRWIHLTLQNMNDMFFMRIKNSNTELPVMRNKHFFTGKKEKENHGWGIESVKNIVEKYDGQIYFKYDSSFFEVSIIMHE